MHTPDFPSIQAVYDRGRPAWERALETFASDVAARLDERGLSHHLRRRIKGLGSLVERLGGKDRVNDLLGLRIVVPFQQDAEAVVGLLQNEWQVLEVERKAENLSYREFGYDSVHVLLSIGDRLPAELPWNCQNVFEVQVRTTLQDAWAEVEHELVYKRASRFPMESVRKKLAALNALLTLADVTFQEIRDQQSALAEWGRERFHELKRKAAVPAEGLEEGLKESGDGALAVARFHAGSELEQVLLEGLVAHRERAYQKAIEHYSRALRMRPDSAIRSVIYNHRGIAHFSLFDEIGALRDFEKAVTWDPNNQRALLNRGLAWRRIGQIEEALLDLERAEEAGANRDEVAYLRAQTFAEIGRTDEARAIVEALLEREPDHEEARALLERVTAEVP